MFKHIQKRAGELLVNQPHASTFVRQHWQALVDGQPPYGLLIEKRTKKGTVYVANTAKVDPVAEASISMEESSNEQ